MLRQQGRAVLWIVPVLALAAALAWWYFAPDTLPPALRHAAPPSPRLDAAPPALYKWRDAQGQLHVTDVPPTDRPYETVRYRPELNVVPAYRKPGEAERQE
ncbi:MAG: DUF4124 domain-containing protein [Lysobacterales bacterium]